jgi:hypothetical protein
MYGRRRKSRNHHKTECFREMLLRKDDYPARSTGFPEKNEGRSIGGYELVNLETAVGTF